MSEKIEVVAKNCNFGEGPHWDDTTQCLYYVDVFATDVHRYNAVTGENSRLNLGESVATVIIPRQKGGFMVTQKSDLAILDSWDSGKVTDYVLSEIILHAMREYLLRTFNIGSTSFVDDVPDVDSWPKYHGSLYSLDADGSINKHLSNITAGNGIDWSDDNSVMYFIDSIPGQVYAYDFDITARTISFTVNAKI
ncbi:regucalcin-like [Haliotis asinina]|uniref:regucalcin-like n=1 Tax=Haliotis asinina TaxID=109174 RepID=UPI003531F231